MYGLGNTTGVISVILNELSAPILYNMKNGIIHTNYLNIDIFKMRISSGKWCFCTISGNVFLFFWTSGPTFLYFPGLHRLCD